MAQSSHIVQIGSVPIGGSRFAVIAGPCSVESKEQFSKTAEWVQKEGVEILRGGIYKLRSQPESFQGLGTEGYQVAKSVKEQLGMAFISEVTDPRQIPALLEIVDAFQVGARNMHNYALLKELGEIDRPVVLKRNFSAYIKEWLSAADYISKGGNPNVILCERGIRTFETATRNTLDLNAVAYVKANSHYPIIVDPSHGTGDAKMVMPLALAAAAAGADGLIVEVHPEPEKALSDGNQSLTFLQFSEMMRSLRKLLPALGRELS
ncbi:MAG: 3-deoxy-7-phosphoheptulonate synthase [Bdellovibrionales bacterium]|nr:3-deoxy-7-phosphoheptulonate synthase [Bdellovibrionales bacterium]